MKALYDLPAPAKLNLFLHVVGRRADGYHLLQSVFMLIDWHDTLSFELRESGALSREDLGDTLPADDLCLRAAAALRNATGCTQGVHIAIDKRVPAQAGLGGGSSDAATCLLALNRLWKLGLGLPALERIGVSLGADVPFFLRGRNAWVEGIGEVIHAIDLPPARFLVVKPAQGLSTQRIFSDPQLVRNTEPAILSGFAAPPWQAFDSDRRGPRMFGRNDLQPVAQRLCPAITEALDWLGKQGLQGRMTGSGSAVFAVLADRESAQSVQDAEQVVVNVQASLRGACARVCSNLDSHPLLGWAASEDG